MENQKKGESGLSGPDKEASVKARGGGGGGGGGGSQDSAGSKTQDSRSQSGSGGNTATGDLSASQKLQGALGQGGGATLKSGETGFRYLVSDDFEDAEAHVARTDIPKDRPSTQSTRRQRSNSGASDALPQIQTPPLGHSDSQYASYDDFDSDSDDDSLKSLEAGFLSPRQQRRGQYDGQRYTSASHRLRGYALRPSKSTVNISSPALANRLGVPLSAELEVWV